MVTDQPLPSAPEAEKQVLGSILLLPEVLPDVRKIIGPLDFFDKTHQALFSAMDLAAECGEPIVDAVLCERLRTLPEFSDGGAAGFLLTIAASSATAADAEYYARKVKEAWGKRQLAELCEGGRNAALNCQSFDSALATVAAGVSELQRSISATKAREKYTLAELRSEYPTLSRPVIDGLLRERETLNLVSVSKVGKSWLAYNLAICNIIGDPWLGRFATSAGKVLLVDNELHKNTLAYRIPVVGDAMGIPRAEYEHGFEILPLRGKLRSLADLANDVDAIEAGKFDLIILDAKYRFAVGGESENDNAAETRLYNLVDPLGERTGSAIILIHHSSKGSQSDKRVVDVGSGAGAQSRAADAHVVLREHADDGVVVLEAAVRSFAPVQPMALRWSFPLWLPDEQSDPARLKRQPAANEQRQAERDRDGLNAIIKALRKSPSTARQLRSVTNIGKDRQQTLLDRLVADGHATTSEVTIRGNRCDEYSLVQDSE